MSAELANHPADVRREIPEPIVYDVSHLTRPVSDAAPFRPESWAKKQTVYGVDFPALAREAADLAPISEAALIEWIRRAVAPGEWGGPRVGITSAPGRLLIHQIPAVHREIDSALGELSARSHGELSASAFLVAHKDNFFKEAEVAFHPCVATSPWGKHLLHVTTLGRDERVDWLLAVSASKNATLVDAGERRQPHARAFSFTFFRQVRYLAGRPDSRSGPFPPSPTARAYDGVHLRLLPLLSRARDSFDLSLAGRIAIIARPHSTLDSAEGEVVVCHQTVFEFELRLDVPAGRSLLVAGLPNPFEEKGDRSYTHGGRRKENLMVLLSLEP
ncbi:MAG: hypothetical protein HY720_05950 [Planctomycetes bacterium]|nr:hypothetical protein [Planctomycetota bacterium]